MAWDDGLEGTAREIARSDANPLRVMAGPGTGKSFALQRRVARLLEEGYAPERILAVTFTRNAAFSLQKDLRALAIPGCDSIRAGTLHAFCFQLLNRAHVFAFLNRTPRALITFNKKKVAQFECQPLLQDILREGNFGGKRNCTRLILAFDAGWARLQHETPGWPSDEVDVAFQESLLEWLGFHRALLIGELVPEALRYLRNNPEAQETSTFEHVIVDEYQDLNRAEQVLLDLLSSNGNLSIVGDVDQSIYSFRHAHPDGIVDFDQTHPSTQDYPLLECRRCPKKVVAIADSLIRHNHPPKGSFRLSALPENQDGSVHIVQWRSLEKEAAGLAGYVKHLIDGRGYGCGDILILSPRRLIGYDIRNALRDISVPVHSFFNEEALEVPEAQRAFTLLTLLADPEDRVALRFYLGLGSPSCNAREYSVLRDHCESSGLSPRAALDALRSEKISLSNTTRILDIYRQLTERLEKLRSRELSEVVDELFPDTAEWAQPLRDFGTRALDKVDSVEGMHDDIKRQITQPEMPEAGEFVRVMSLYKSKGLTSKVVIVTSCIQGLIPTINRKHTSNEAAANLKEQRRLFYVALTRCREILVLSSVSGMPRKLAYNLGARVAGGRVNSPTIASTFMGELGPTMPGAIRGADWIQKDFLD